MTRLKIERLGGFAGFGMPGSALKSVGEQAMSDLSAADQALVEAMFAKPPPTGTDPVRDGFQYRITLSKEGRDTSVDVPEGAVPDALKAAVKDRLM